MSMQRLFLKMIICILSPFSPEQDIVNSNVLQIRQKAASKKINMTEKVLTKFTRREKKDSPITRSNIPRVFKNKIPESRRKNENTNFGKDAVSRKEQKNSVANPRTEPNYQVPEKSSAPFEWEDDSIELFRREENMTWQQKINFLLPRMLGNMQKDSNNQHFSENSSSDDIIMTIEENSSFDDNTGEDNYTYVWTSATPTNTGTTLKSKQSSKVSCATFPSKCSEETKARTKAALRGDYVTETDQNGQHNTDSQTHVQDNASGTHVTPVMDINQGRNNSCAIEKGKWEFCLGTEKREMKTAIVSNTQVKPSLNNADKIHRLPVNSTPLRSFACEMEEAVTQDLSSIPQVHHRQLQLETTPKVITVPDDRSPKKVKKFQQNHPPLHSTQLFVSQHNDISDAVTKDLSSIKAESLEKGEAISSSVQTVSNFHGSQLSPLRVPASKNPVLTSTPSSSVRGPKTFPGFDMDLSSVLATPNELEVHDSTIVNSMEIVPLEDESIVGLPLYPVGVELHAVVPLPDLKEQKDVQETSRKGQLFGANTNSAKADLMQTSVKNIENNSSTVQQACKLTDISTGKQSDVSQKGNIQQIKCNQQNGKGLDESKMVECTDVHISLRSDSSNKDIGKEQSVKIQTVDCPVDNNIDRDIGVNPKFSSVERNMTIGRVFKSQRKNNTGSRKNGPKLSKGGKARNVCGGCETDKAGKLKHLIKNSNNKMMSLKRTGNHQKIAIYSRAYDTIGGRYCDLGKIDMVPDEVWNTWPKRKTKVYCKTLQSLPRNQPIPNDMLVM